MNIPLTELADRFVKHIPSEFVFLGIEDAKQAGALLQRLATALTPSVEGGLTLTDQSLRQFATLYVQNDLAPSPEKKPVALLFGECLLEHAPGVKQEGIAFLAEEIGISPEALLRDAGAAGKAMSSPLHEFADKFAEHIASTYPSFYPETLDHVTQAGAQLQRLATGLSPWVEGGLTLTDQNLKRIADLYVENTFLPRKPVAHLFGECLLEHAPGVKPEGIAFLAEEIGITPEALLRKGGVTTPTAEHFVNAVLDAAPVAAVQAQIAEVREAAQQLQTLHAVLSPLVAGRLEFKDDSSVQRVGQELADRFLQPEASREALKPFLVKTLLEETATPEERAQLVADLAEITAGARATVPTLATSWVDRSEMAVAGRGV